MRIFIITKAHLIRIGIAAAAVVMAVLLVLALQPGVRLVFAPKDNIPVYSVKTEGKQVAITFDAAWGTDKTFALLDILDQYHVKATFFVTGMWAKKNADVLAEIARRGHEIGSHGYTHKDLTTLPEKDVIDELTRTADVIEQATGHRPTAFRAPYGAWNAKLVDIVGKEQLDFFQWDVDSLDWKGLSSEQMQARVFPRVVSGSIILFHNDGEHTPEVMPVILEKLIADGYKPVTVTELLGESLEAAKKGD